MSVFSENIVNEVSVVEKVRVAVERVLDEVVDLVNNHFDQCQPIIKGSGGYFIHHPSDTTMSFVIESDDKLKELCRGDFGRKYGLLIVKPITLKKIASEPIDKTDSTTTYEVKVHIDYFVDGSTILSTDAATMYTDIDFFYTKTIYNQPHYNEYI